MISIFRDKSIITIFSLIIVAILFHLHIFFVPIKINYCENSGVLSWLFIKYLNVYNATIISIIYLLLLIIQSIRVNVFLNSSKMFSKTGYTTAFAFILLTAMFTNAFAFSPSIVAISLINWIFYNALKLYNTTEPKKLLFNVGFVACISSVLYTPIILVVVGLLIALIILRPFRITEWLIFLFGLVAPLYLIFSGLFLFDSIYVYKNFIPKIQFHFSISTEPWILFRLCVITLLSFVGLLTWYPNNNRMVIQTRKSWTVMLIFFILLLVGTMFFNSNNFQPEIICLIPMAAFISNFFLYPRRTILINLLIILSLIIITYNNLILIQA